MSTPAWQTLNRDFASKAKTSKSGKQASSGEDHALAMAIQHIEKSFGKGALMKLGARKVNQDLSGIISTGSLGLDIAVGVGGLPSGRVVEIYGPESSGKTTLALHVVAEAQKQGGTCAFIDAEHALDPEYASNIGVDIDELYISQPDSGEQALEMADVLVRSGTMKVIVIDSVAALTPKSEIEGDMGDHHVALQARLMSQALRKITGSLAKTGCLLIFINQIRSKVGVIFGSPEVTAGGNALKFYSSVRLDIRRKGLITEGDNPVGALTKVKVAKNKVAPPFKTVEFEVIFGEGIDRLGEILDAGLKLGIIKRKGAYYSYSKNAIESALKPKKVEKEVSNEDEHHLLNESEGETNDDGMNEPATESNDEDDLVLMGQGRVKSKLFLQDNTDVQNSVEAAIRRLAFDH